MLPYWFFFLLPVLFVTTPVRWKQDGTVRAWSTPWWAIFVILVLAIGLREQVGGDWFNYLAHLDDAAEVTFLEALSALEPSYTVLNWMAAHWGGGVYFVNTVCAFFFACGLVIFCRDQPRPWLALVVAMPYLVTVVAMGYTRQGVAIGFAMLALVALTRQKIMLFVIWVAVAATFHKSAVILMPLAVLSSSNRRIWTVLWVGITSLLFYGLLLQDSVENLRVNYLEREYESSGAAIRIIMNAFPAALFLVFSRKFGLPRRDRVFWTWMSLFALAFVVLLQISPSSTAVDRIALYWIPLQLYVLSRLPNAIGVANGRNDIWVCLIVAYSAAVLFVWLEFATNAPAWIPYQFYPWVALWR